jgi:uncharacterized membrane protein YjgN (DUF898 family)
MNALSSNLITPGESDIHTPVPAPPTAAAAQRIHQLPITFTGVGSDYFRIWIVNLLLTGLTLGLYHPWAKVRRLRYFHGHILVGGKPLAFTGEATRMLPGHLLVGLLVVAYGVAAQGSTVAGFLVFLAAAAVTPALYKAAWQFRLSHTCWRGLHLKFRGSMAGAYAAVLPFFAPGAVVLAALMGVSDPTDPPTWYGFLAIGVLLATMALFPWWCWRLSQYRHNHTGLEHLQVAYRGSLGSFYGVFLKTAGVLCAAAGVSFLAVALVVDVFIGAETLQRLSWAQAVAAPQVVVGHVIALGTLAGTALAVPLLARPYFLSRMQNLQWNRHGGKAYRFVCLLPFLPLLGLVLKNSLMLLLTLGLYWPHAVVAMARLRLQTVVVNTRQPSDILVAEMTKRKATRVRAPDSGFFGLPLGL